MTTTDAPVVLRASGALRAGATVLLLVLVTVNTLVVPLQDRWAIFVRTHEDLRFRLDVTIWPFPRPLEGRAAALRSWRDGRPQAFL